MPNPQPIRVLLVDDAPGAHPGVLNALRRDEVALAGVVASAAAALRACEELGPEVVIVDAGLRLDEALATVEEVMAFRPTPVLLLADAADAPVAARARALGALDVLARPPAGCTEDEQRALAQRLRLLAGVKVIRHVRGRRRPRAVAHAEVGCVVGIAASLGGPRALAALLKGLPQPFPAPVCIVQHISEGFSQGLAAWLASESGREVREAVSGEALEAGRIVVAPTGRHLIVGDRGQALLADGPPVAGFRPSATVLFDALARHYGARAVGVVLTGMGSDGADGLAAIRNAGGRTLAQDEASSVVFGMARAAAEAGAIERLLPLGQLAQEIAATVRAILAPEGAR